MLNIFESNISFLNDKKKSTRMSNECIFLYGSKHVAYQKEMLRRVGIKKKLPLVVYRNFDGDHSELGTLKSD